MKGKPIISQSAKWCKIMKKTFTGKMIHNERRNNSYYGNPKYFGVFQNESGETFAGTTATNASCAYGFMNYPNQTRTITYHTTKNGNNIIDSIKIENN